MRAFSKHVEREMSCRLPSSRHQSCNPVVPLLPGPPGSSLEFCAGCRWLMLGPY